MRGINLDEIGALPRVNHLKEIEWNPSTQEVSVYGNRLRRALLLSEITSTDNRGRSTTGFRHRLRR